MFTKQDFIEQYQTISDADLLGILDNKKDYQRLAIEAANEELARRNLSQQQLQDARLIISTRARKTRRQEQVEAVTGPLSRTSQEILETLQPSFEKPRSSRTQIILIGLFFGLVAIYQVGSNLRWLELYTRIFFRNPVDAFITLLPALLLPVAVVLFVARKKIGWILLVCYLTYSSVWALKGLTISARRHADNDTLATLFPEPSLWMQVLLTGFYFASIFVLAKADMRQEYQLTKKSAFKVFAFTWLATFFIIFVSS